MCNDHLEGGLIFKDLACLDGKKQKGVVGQEMGTLFSFFRTFSITLFL